MSAGRAEWRGLASELPWLRGASVYFADRRAAPVVMATLERHDFTVTQARSSHPRPRFDDLAEALRLPLSTSDNLDALRDSLSELVRWWPGVSRLALLWHDADVLLSADAWSFTQAVALLTTAASTARQDGLIFESVLLVDGYGADRPTTA